MGQLLFALYKKKLNNFNVSVFPFDWPVCLFQFSICNIIRSSFCRIVLLLIWQQIVTGPSTSVTQVTQNHFSRINAAPHHHHQTTTPSTSIRIRFCVAVLLISDKMLNFAHFWCFFIYHFYLICGNLQHPPVAGHPKHPNTHQKLEKTSISTFNTFKRHLCLQDAIFLMWHISFKMSTFPFLEWAQTRGESASTTSKNRLGRIQEI